MLKLSTTALLMFATTVVASADPEPPVTPPSPAAVTSSPPSAEASTGYVRIGTLVGCNSGYAVIAPTFEVGDQLAHSPLWFHAQFTGGAALRPFEAGNGVFGQARAGVELRRCFLNHVLCGWVGEDAGIELESWTGHEGLSDDDTSMSSLSGTQAIAVSRVELDAGTGRTHFGVGLDVVATLGGLDGVDLGATIAHRF